MNVLHSIDSILEKIKEKSTTIDKNIKGSDIINDIIKLDIFIIIKKGIDLTETNEILKKILHEIDKVNYLFFEYYNSWTSYFNVINFKSNIDIINNLYVRLISLETNYTFSNKMTHILGWLEMSSIAKCVYDDVIKKINKYTSTTEFEIKKPHDVIDVLAEMKFNEYYEHYMFIYLVLTDKDISDFTDDMKKQILFKYYIVYDKFNKYKPTKRTQMLPNNYVIHKICELLEYTDFLDVYPLLKCKNKLKNVDKIWKTVCIGNNWKFISSFG
jgi:hypothetical protein